MEPKLKTPGDTSWFVKDRFGMFIHWGLYALPARHEWVKMKEEMTDEQYQQYFDRFDPDLYDPEKWADAAANAGMKYFVITTKHHDGFCLWDSKHTDYKATKTPYGKDLLRPMVDAFTKRGLRTGFYHSLLDWHHPDYIVDKLYHPDRNRLPGCNGPDNKPITKDINQGRDPSRYAKYLQDQVTELLSEFSPVEIMWFDFSFVNKASRLDFTKGKGREAWESEKLYKIIRDIAPNIILTDRLDMDIPLSGGDMKTPEGMQPRKAITIEHQGKKIPVVWEACQTFSESWGYFRDEHTWRSTRQLLSSLIDCVSNDGNMLLNVGPTGRGEFDSRAMARLQGIGKWMHYNSRSIYNCTQAPDEFKASRDTRLTYNPDKKRLYVHLFNWPYKHLMLDGQAFADRVVYAQFLHDASEIKMGLGEWYKQHTQGADNALVLNIPQTEPDGIEIPVIELYLKD